MGVFPCRGWVAPCQRTPRSITGLPLRVNAARAAETGQAGADTRADDVSGLIRARIDESHSQRLVDKTIYSRALRVATLSAGRNARMKEPICEQL